MTLIDFLHHLIADEEHVELGDLLDALLTHPSTHTGASNWAVGTRYNDEDLHIRGSIAKQSGKWSSLPCCRRTVLMGINWWSSRR